MFANVFSSLSNNLDRVKEFKSSKFFIQFFTQHFQRKGIYLVIYLAVNNGQVCYVWVVGWEHLTKILKVRHSIN